MSPSLGVDVELLDAAWAAVNRQWPDLRGLVGGMILGSGWGGVAEAFTAIDAIDYASVPGLGRPRVSGHAGRLLRARAGPNREILVFQGRRHFYEGDGWTPVIVPIHLMRMCGCPRVLLTNAAGGIAPHLSPGLLMAIRDHINVMGDNPLCGALPAAWSAPRFPDMTDVYSAAWRNQLRRAAEDCGVGVIDGVYAAVRGPNYETPAEVAALQLLGADAVGMSTVPEALAARSAGLEVGGLCCIANRAAGMGVGRLDHAEVERVMSDAVPVARRLLVRFWTSAPP